ncbi:MAG: NAD(P)(+) transhydrogenase (Re/Si-specific) subunit beta, partial [bacterium]|nr:NAD(P)(+) transhydrogenase (Re/Si-specific) subunit beta [bacterium]
MPADWTNLAYLIASILFILGIRGMTHPRTARRGNFLSAVGMLLAISVTLPQVHRSGWTLVIAGLGVGTLIGAPLSRLVKMKAVPQLVAIFNGFGGGASVLVAGATLIGLIGATSAVGKPYQELVATAASGLIGTVTFWGSMVAFAKLQEIKIFSKPLALPGQQFLKGLFFTAALVLAVMVVLNPSQLEFYWGLVGVATVLGFILVLPIGGGDMP